MSSFSNNQSRRNSRNKSHSFVPYSTRQTTQYNLSNNDSMTQSTSKTNHPVKSRANRIIGASFYHDSETSEGTKSTQNNVTMECSSDNSSIIQTRPVKRRKISVNTQVSSSESGAPRQTERATSKRIRLFSSSDSNSSSTLHSSSNRAIENKDIALTGSFENEITPPHKQRKRRRRRRRRSNNTIPNQLTAQTQRMLILSRHNWVITPSKNHTQSTRQTDGSGIRSNMTQVRNTRPSASTNAASQNSLMSGVRQSRRMLGEMIQNTTSAFPTRRQNVRFFDTNNPNFSSDSSPNTRHGRRPNSDQRNNTSTVLNRQTVARARRPSANQRNSTRTSVNRQSESERPNRTARNRETVQRTSRNPTPVTTSRENMTCTDPVESNEETGHNLRTSMRNGQHVTSVHNPSTDLRANSDSDNSSSSSINELRPVVLSRRRVIFSSDNATSSDSDASSVVVNRVRRPIRMVLSESESEENPREKEVKASGNAAEVIHSDTDSETEKCPICFGRFEQQEVGTPKTCKHCFCLECIKKWAENNNTCPVDRRTFDSIIVRSTVQGEVVREEGVPPPEMPNQFSDGESFSDILSEYGAYESDLDLFAVEFDEDFDAPDYGFEDFDDFPDDVEYDVPEYDGDYDTPDIEVDYDVPEYEVDYDYDTPDIEVDYDSPDNYVDCVRWEVDSDSPENNVDYDTPDIDADYDTQDNDVDYDTPDNGVNYDTQDNDMDYDTPDNGTDYDTQDNDMDYDTPDNGVDYDTQDNDVDHEAPEYTDEEYDSPDYDGPDEICVVCSTGDGEEMVICDLCDNVYHLQCLDPPLQEIPVNFSCLECVRDF